jgi:hypothetical protein
MIVPALLGKSDALPNTARAKAQGCPACAGPVARNSFTTSRDSWKTTSVFAEQVEKNDVENAP